MAIGDLYADGRGQSRLRGLRFSSRASFYRKGFFGVVSPAAAVVRLVAAGTGFGENGKQCWPAFMRRDFQTVRRKPRFTPRCSTKAAIIARFAPCIGFWKARARCVSAATSLRNPAYTKPELLATGPNQLWSGRHHETARSGQVDILLSLRDPRRLQPLCGGLDGRRRWKVRNPAKRLIVRDTCEKQKIEPGKLTIHADRGSSMTSKLRRLSDGVDLGITKTHSRPHVSDDNPYSEKPLPGL